MIIPKVKKEEFTGEIAVIPKKLTVSGGKYGKEICHLLKYFLPQCEAECSAENPHIKVIEIPGETEEYTINTDGGNITISYSTYTGLRNAVAALAQLARADESSLYLPMGSVSDYPVTSHRGVMLDLARGIKNFESLKRDIILIAKLKMNVIHLHLSDSDGSCFEMESLPKEYWLEGAYTKKQMLELVELAGILALEIIPEFDIPAHSGKMIQVFPEFGCRIKGKENLSPWTVCPGTPEIYDTYEKVIDEIISVFPGKYFHMGGDELEFADVPELNALCWWDECEKCRSLREKEGLSDRQDEYYYFTKRIYDIVKKKGRQLIMWSDQLDCNRKKELPDDIIMQFWRVAAPMRGPVEGCSMNAQLKMGYEIINSYYPETYVDIEEYMSSDTLSSWRWDKRPECDAALAGQIMGSEICAWDYGKKDMHYDKTLPSAVAVMADKLWNGEDIEYTAEYRRAVTKAVLGAETPQTLDVFGCLGDIIPPRTQEPAYYEKICVSGEELKKTAELLAQKELYHEGDGERAKIYLKCIEAACEFVKGESIKNEA